MTPEPTLTDRVAVPPTGTPRAAVPVMICAYCPDFDRTAPVNAGASHGICPACIETFEAPSKRPVASVEWTIENAQRAR